VNKLKKKQDRVSRRRFVTLGLLGTGGLWTAWTDLCAARVLPRLFAETRRPVARPKFCPAPDRWDDNALTATWLGHSTVLLNFYGITILTDPVLFRRVGADLRIGTVGPKRLIDPPLTVWQLPPIDLVLLSHAHMDHLDVPTLRGLPASTQVVTARATGDILRRTRLRKVTELGWGEKKTLHVENGRVQISAFEVKHWGARWRRDTYRGYNGYVLNHAGKKIIFGGDTAMSDTFRPLHSQGPFEMAIMPIGAYQPWECSHCTPEQSLRMADQAGAQYFLPIHHRTFCLGQEGQVEPMERLEAAVEKGRLALRDVGETFRCS
jgi:L-ascorbate metabolism protein UlaG (beta-lactamase superfamily)